MMDQMRYPVNLRNCAPEGPRTVGVLHAGNNINCNGSRLESGTSGSSESSRGNGKPPRRRSHRPRGCRGGSNRRRNNSSDHAKKQNSSKGSCHGSNENNHNKFKIDKKTVVVKHQQKRSMLMSKQNSAPMEEFTILNRLSQMGPGQYVKCPPRPLFHRDNSIGSSMSFSTAPLTDSSSSLASYDSSSFISSNQNDFASIHPSLSDSSSEFTPPDPLSLMLSSTLLPFGNDGDNQILPPLPSDSFSDTQSIPTGPNPYALKLVTHENMCPIPTSFSKQTYNPSKSILNHSKRFEGGYATPLTDLTGHASNMPPPSYHQLRPNYDKNPDYESNGNGTNIQMDVQTHRHFQYQQQVSQKTLPRHGPSELHSLVANSSSSNINTNQDYRAERLEIQRQSVEGGSLFVTSPRSFLMGKRTAVSAAGPTF